MEVLAVNVILKKLSPEENFHSYQNKSIVVKLQITFVKFVTV